MSPFLIRQPRVCGITAKGDDAGVDAGMQIGFYRAAEPGPPMENILSTRFNVQITQMNEEY